MRHGGGNRWLAVAASLALHAGVFALIWQSPPPFPTLQPGSIQVTLLAPASAAAHPPAPPERNTDNAAFIPAPAKTMDATASAPPPGTPASLSPMATPSTAMKTAPTSSFASAMSASSMTDPAHSKADASSAPTAPTPSGAVTSNQVMASLEEAFTTHFYYPMLARRKGWEGDVMLALRVEIDGVHGA